MGGVRGGRVRGVWGGGGSWSCVRAVGDAGERRGVCGGVRVSGKGCVRGCER